MEVEWQIGKRKQRERERKLLDSSLAFCRVMAEPKIKYCNYQILS